MLVIISCSHTTRLFFSNVLLGSVLPPPPRRRYEELVERPEAIMRDIIVNRLQLEWEPAVLEFHNNNRTVQTHSQSRKLPIFDPTVSMQSFLMIRRTIVLHCL